MNGDRRRASIGSTSRATAGERRRRPRCVRLVAAQEHLDDGGDRRDDERRVEPVASRKPRHGATVLPAGPSRLLLE
jgi:hypothetical protein